jgi:hypothetical protein
VNNSVCRVDSSPDPFTGEEARRTCGWRTESAPGLRSTGRLRAGAAGKEPRFPISTVRAQSRHPGFRSAQHRAIWTAPVGGINFSHARRRHRVVYLSRSLRDSTPPRPRADPAGAHWLLASTIARMQCGHRMKTGRAPCDAQPGWESSMDIGAQAARAGACRIRRRRNICQPP